MDTGTIRTIALAGIAATAMLLTGCATGPRIVTQQDPDTDFSAFRTFDFMSPLSTDRSGATSIMSSNLMSATTQEMEARGLERVEGDADLLINFFTSTQERIQTRQSPSTSASFHARRGRYGTWPSYSMSVSTTQVTQTTEGTLAIDVVDVSRAQLVWEGAATKRVTDSTRQNLEEIVRSAVADIFAEFPVAPSGQP